MKIKPQPVGVVAEFISRENGGICRAIVYLTDCSIKLNPGDALYLLPDQDEDTDEA
jgi:hypothetical protein